MEERAFKILIIDDSPEDRAEIRRMLLTHSTKRLKLTEACNGADGIATIHGPDGVPDCVLLDFSLPDMTAIEILTEVRGDGDLTICPVVVLTGSDEGGSKVIAAGAQDYLGKSWASAAGLNRSIDNAVERYSLAKERLRAIEELKASEEFSRAVIESSQDCIEVLSRNGLLLLINEPGRILLEIEESSSVLGSAWEERWPIGSRASVRESMRRALKGEGSRFEQFSPTAKGNPKWWDVQVSPVFNPDSSVGKILAVSRDVTVQKGIKESLEETSQRLSLGLEVSGVCLAHVDYVEGSILLSPDAARLFGLGDTETTVSRDVLHSIFHPGDKTELDSRIAGASDPNGTGYFEMDHRIIRPDGEVRWVRVHKRVTFGMTDHGLRPVRAVLAALDITAQKNAEIELADAARRKDEFLAMLAHELRNPLAPLLTGVEVMTENPSNAALVAKIGGMIQRQVGQMAHLIDDLLDVSRIGAAKIELQIEDVPLAKVVAQAVESVRPLIDRFGHALEIFSPPGELTVRADYHRLTQIVSNLLSNSAKYTPEGGHIVLSVFVRGADTVAISVKDNGRGIEPHHQPHIFELFNQGSSGPKEGLGIGLTLVKSLIEMHGGSISLTSEGAGMGSEFVITLPGALVIASPARQDNTPSVSQAAGLKVLVADDGRATADILGLFFQTEGVECRTVYDGAEAVKEAGQFSPDLVCLDLGMPVMDGYEAARSIRDLNPECYLVALSGWGSEEDRRKTAEAGFHEHLVKPVSPADLRALLTRIQAKH